jgi:hypothetical protein
VRRRTGLALLGASAVLATIAAIPSSAVPAGRAASPIRHVFLIVLENESYDASYVHNANPWLGRKLPAQGTLLTQYYGIGHESNPNYLAMISGQGPNPMTQSDCQGYTDFEPAPVVFDPRGNGQALGIGCVYPRNVKTLGDQLTANGLSWRGYMEDMGNDTTREPAHCGEPAFSAGTGFQDGTQKATANDQYAARHNPFVYFHSLIDSGQCHRRVVPLTVLGKDLQRVRTTPNFSFITPNLCDDGHDAPCVGKDATGSNAGGLTSVDHWLSVWIPRIERSPAYQRDGLIVITTDESANSDAASCCGEQPGPDTPLPGITGVGGGRVGSLVIGRCVAGGKQDATPYNHYSLLRSLEDIFGIRTGGSDGHGHLGYAGATGLRPFGKDVFGGCTPVER